MFVSRRRSADSYPSERSKVDLKSGEAFSGLGAAKQRKGVFNDARCTACVNNVTGILSRLTLIEWIRCTIQVDNGWSGCRDPSFKETPIYGL